MTPRIFVTGATGYIGGDALYTLMQAHPDYDVTALVRNIDKGAQVASQYPTIKLVYGNLDNVELLEQEARKADIVLNFANADHEDAAKALIKGLAGRSQEHPGYLIHTSGTGILMYADLERKIFGEASAKIYDDWEGIEEVTSLPDFAPHRKVDKVVLAAGMENESKIKTAIVCPPTIYGKGRGPGNQRGHQVYELSRVTLEKKSGIQVGPGRTYWTSVHIYDLSDCYVTLVEAAVKQGGKATWGKEGYYFTENGDIIWGEISQVVATTAHKQGLLPSDEVVTVSNEEANRLSPWGALLWGGNSRARAIRARKLLDWSPKEKSLIDEIPEIVASEAKKLGLVQGHAAQVAS